MNAQRILSLAISFLVCGGIAWCDGPQGKLAKAIRTEHFVVYYDPADPDLAKTTAGIAENELARIAVDLGYVPEPDRPFPLYAYPTHEDFIQAGGHSDRQYLVGTARAGDSAISIDASEVFISNPRVLGHEITHAIVFRKLGALSRRLPAWFSEGLAQYESDPNGKSDEAAVAKAAADGMLIDLAVLFKSFPREQEGLAYAESGSAVRYMVERFGKSTPRELLHELRSHPFLKSMLYVTGRTTGQFQDEWFAHVTERYRELRITAIVSSLISASMALLAIAAFVRRRKQKIAAARQWEDEEVASPPDFYQRPPG